MSQNWIIKVDKSNVCKIVSFRQKKVVIKMLTITLWTSTVEEADVAFEKLRRVMLQLVK